MSDNSSPEIMNLLTQLHSQMITQKDDIKEIITKQISESYNSLRSDMSQMVDSLKAEFKYEIESVNNKIVESSSSFKQQIDQISNTVQQFSSRLDSVEKDYERIAHLNELKLIGIPVTDNENLLEMFMKLADVVGYDMSNATNAPSLTRVLIKNRVTNQLTVGTTIIVKFVAVHMKDTFYSQYLRMLPSRKLTTKDLGFSCDTRIIIGENLSRGNHDIFIAASNLRRENKLAQVFTINGIVNIKLQKGGTTYELRHKHNLDQLMALQTTTNQQNQTTLNVNQMHGNVNHASNAQTNGIQIQSALNASLLTPSTQTDSSPMESS